MRGLQNNCGDGCYKRLVRQQIHLYLICMNGEPIDPPAAFAAAVEAAGGQSAFERLTGMSQQRISYRLGKGMSVPSEFVLKAEAGTGVSRHDLRPDIYPPEGSSLGAEVSH